MADHVELETVATPAAKIATDQRAGDSAHFQLVKLAYGALDTFNIVTSIGTNPLPVALSSIDNAVLDTIDDVLDTINAKLVTGTVIGDVNLGTIGGAATEVTLATLGTEATLAAIAGYLDTEIAAILTAVQLIDNVIYTHDAAGGTPVGIMLVGVRDDEVGSTAVTTTDGDATALRTDKFGALKTTQLPDATSEIKYAVVNAASGDNEIVAAAGAGIKIRVLSAFLVAGGTTTARFESAAGGTALTGVMPLVVNSGFTLPYNPTGWFETADNAALSLEATGDLDGCVTYVEV